MVIYWDTSALVPLLVQETQTLLARRLLVEDPQVITWWGTRVECASALARLEREDAMSPPGVDSARALLGEFCLTWAEVNATDEVREHAQRLLLRHPLRAADALQLGAALVWADARPRGQGFASLDGRLSLAARGEGFSLPLGA